MPRRSAIALGITACAAAIASPAARSAELSKDYLAGAWAVGGAAGCGTASAEHIACSPDGTFGATRAGNPTAVGFWFLVQDHLDLHMITSPAFFDDPASQHDEQLGDFVGQYSYYDAKALLFDVAETDFRMVATIGEVMRGANLGRCPGSG